MYLITDINCSLLWKQNSRIVILHIYFFPVYVNDRGYNQRNTGP